MGWFRRLSLRGRLVLIGTTGLAAGLALGGLMLVNVLQYVLLHALDNGARQTASDVAALVEAGALSDPIPNAGTQWVQVIDSDGRIRAASVGGDRLVALLRPAELDRAKTGRVVVVGGDRIGAVGDLRVVAMQAGSTRTILVAAPDHDVLESVQTVRNVLLIAYPLLVGGLAALAWRVVGWTLRPVEALRAGAEEISAAQVGRLPVPEGDDEVHRLAITLNAMLARLEAARARQRAFVGDAAHELRSPIASLRTQLEVAEHLGEPAPTADLRVDVDRLARLVDDLLLLARADGGDPRLRHREPVELAALVRATADTWVGAQVPVTVTPSHPHWIDGDLQGMRRVLDNLISNAVRHAASRVEMSVTGGERTAVITVTDDGPGIPAPDRDRVFDRFTRLDDARARDDGGTGLGLAIVRELVRLHAGRVTLSDARPGLRVVITLPVRNRPTPGGERVTDHPPGERVTGESAGGAAG